MHERAGLLLHVLRDIEPPVAHELLARFPCGEAHQLPRLERRSLNPGTVQLLPDIHIQVVICDGHD